MRLTVLRLEETSEHTLGVIAVNGKLICYSLELPWKDNEQNISCIPFGCYRAHRYVSRDHGSTFRFECVPGRSEIIFHAGNSVKDTEGCILLGTRPGYHRYRRWLWGSQDAFRELMDELSGKTELDIAIWSMKI